MQTSLSHIQALLAERKAAQDGLVDPWELIDRNLRILAEFSRTWTDPEDFQYLAHMRALVQELRMAHFNLTCEIDDALKLQSREMLDVLREMMRVAEKEVEACAAALRHVVDGASQDGLGTEEQAPVAVEERAPEVVEMAPLAAAPARPLTPISRLAAGKVADKQVPEEFWYPQVNTRGQWVN